MKPTYAQPAKDWLSVFVELGYYDDQHLVRDFREFIGQPPNAFLQAEDARSPERAFWGDGDVGSALSLKNDRWGRAKPAPA